MKKFILILMLFIIGCSNDGANNNNNCSLLVYSNIDSEYINKTVNYLRNTKSYSYVTACKHIGIKLLHMRSDGIGTAKAIKLMRLDDSLHKKDW